MFQFILQGASTIILFLRLGIVAAILTSKERFIARLLFAFYSFPKWLHLSAAD
jgi:hypothetical protein